ncbi:hypothetical protein [Methylovirgula sp. 4M-Z18]|uniref:hypothetical protein n=1 Tax=Methylovirgula sp. 4M-Z18 TaxID=2293567 RepID=UPI000E2E4536|nr:hypothetical protein [Methylovirgula sp. 4M-Z18]RFB78253.1 hypothetical protein DYH55_17980 [Methylovirgula sp. 4M-Z18]
MADYYPLLARAIAGLPNQTPEARRAVFERARKALLGQLENMQPPIPKEDIDREAEALDQAIARLEAEYDPLIKEIEEAIAPSPPPAETEAPSPSIEGPPAAAAPPDVVASRHAPEPAGSSAPQIQILAGGESAASSAPPIVVEAPRPPLRPVDAPEEEVLRKTPPEAPTRPAAPVPRQEKKSRVGYWVTAAVLAAVLVGAGILAMRWRDNPDELAAAHKAAMPAPPADTGSGKVPARISAAPLSPPVSTVTAPSVAIHSDTPPETDTAPQAPAADTSQPNQNQASQTPTSPAGQASQTGGPTVAAAAPQRAEFTIPTNEHPDGQAFPGTVQWRVENTVQVNGQTLPDIVADADIPDLKFHVTLRMKKNVDPTPIANQIELYFQPQSTSPITSVSGIGSVSAFNDNASPDNVNIAGVMALPRVPNVFLVFLPAADAERDQNTQLLEKRDWLRLTMTINGNIRATLNLLKGPSGTQAINDAFAAWK